MKKSVRSPISILIMIVIIISLYFGGNITYDLYLSGQIEALHASATKNYQYYGYLTPKVIDGFTNEPIEEAVIIIPELEQSYTTGPDGCTSPIRIPIIEDSRYKKIMPKSWGESTLIVYKDGYIDYVLFYTHVWENQTRKGPEILLFPEPDDKKSDPFSIVEGPHRLWVKELVDKFRP